MNIFKFDYKEEILKDDDGKNSRFSVIRGDEGKVVHVKKSAYTLIETESLSKLSDIFSDRGHIVKPFVHKYGEIIGLNVDYGKKMLKVGDKNYRAIITVPNNGNGSGYLSIQETRLICTNGSSRTSDIGSSIIKIPHIFSYPKYLKIIEDSTIAFEQIIDSIEEKDLKLDAIKMDDVQIRFELNKWFFENELPIKEREEIGSLLKFREMLAVDPDSIEYIDRYNQLLDAYKREIAHNLTLGLTSSAYTVFATCSNYLSRRIEKSLSKAPKEIKFQRESKKLKNLIIENV